MLLTRNGHQALAEAIRRLVDIALKSESRLARGIVELGLKKKP